MSNDKVGYGNPPEETRFVKGKSGNPKGRPKGRKNFSTMLQTISRERIPVTVNGRVKYMTKLEACIHQLSNKAASGDMRAIRELFYWCRLIEEPGKEAWSPGELDGRDSLIMESLLRRFGQTADALSISNDPGASDPKAISE
jgi:hypothetical protein